MTAVFNEHSDSEDFGRQAIFASSGISIVVGAAVLVGWVLDVAAIKSVLPGLPPMKANAALGFILLGVAIFGHRRKRLPRIVWISYAAAGCLMLLAAATIAEHVLNVNFGIDELLFRDHMATPSRLVQPGRMSPLAAANFFLLGAALIQNRFRSSVALWCQQLCILSPLLVSARALVGLLYGVPMLYQLHKAPMALHTIITFLVVCIGLLLSRRDYYLTRLCDVSTAGSVTARKVVCWTIGLPLVVGLCCLQGEKWGLFQAQYGLTIFVVLITLFLMVLLVFLSSVINQLDRQRELAAGSARDFQLASQNDFLTGLLNRRGLLDRGEQEVARSRRDGSPLACLVFDLDFFKKINDVHGHKVGDEVLRQVAAILMRGCRLGDLVGRLGGEEFCVLLCHSDEKDAKEWAERLRVEIAAQRIFVGSTQLSVTCSGGVGELRSYHTSVHSLIDGADTALLVAKQTGRNKVVAASSLEEGAIPKDRGGPLQGVLARDIMVPVLSSVTLEMTVSQVAQRLMEMNLDSLPVVDEDGRVAGFITEQDVMNAMLDPPHGAQMIADCNHISVAVFDETVEAEQIAEFFSRSSVQRVVIIRQGIPVGLVSRRTLLRWFLNYSLNQETGALDVGSGDRIFNRERTGASIREIAGSLSRLANTDILSGDEFVRSALVSEATRIQESIENLLLRCRRSDPRPREIDMLTTGAMSIS